MFREVWPEGDVFGSSDVEPEEELDLLKQIFNANLPSNHLKMCLTRCLTATLLYFKLTPFFFIPGPAPEAMNEEEDDGAELEEEELESVQLSEKEFNFLDFIKKWENI